MLPRTTVGSGRGPCLIEVAAPLIRVLWGNAAVAWWRPRAYERPILYHEMGLVGGQGATSSAVSDGARERCGQPAVSP